MEERQATVDQVTYQIDEPFMVVATQNPLEHEGVFPLPQSQIDRFTMRIRIGYPGHEAEMEVLDTHGAVSALEDVQPVLTAREVIALIRVTREVHVAEDIKNYIVKICEATREHPSVQQGASPRASLFLLRCSRATASSAGREYVLPDDVKAMIPLVLSHRLVLAPEAALRGSGGDQVLSEVVSRIPVPAGGSRAKR
jgi:MoxR-like ATPase